MKWDQNNPEKVKDFIAKMKQNYAFKKAYAARRAWEFYNHPDVAGMCYVAVGGLDSITLFLFLRSIGIEVPGTSVSMLEDRSIQKVHKALGIRALRPANGPKDRPYTKIEVIREHGFHVLSKEIAGKISLLQHPSEKNATVRHAIMTGETGAYGGYRKNTRMKMSQKWLEKFGGPENEKYGTNYQTAPFKVSDLCCYYLKEKPCNDYARSSRRFPYMGLMASEGGRRQKALMLNGCNYISKDTKRSAPFAIFTRQDILTLALEMEEYYQEHWQEFKPITGENEDGSLLKATNIFSCFQNRNAIISTRRQSANPLHQPRETPGRSAVAVPTPAGGHMTTAPRWSARATGTEKTRQAAGTSGTCGP